MWRGVSEAEPFLTGRTMIMADSNRRTKFVAYPIAGRGGRALLNWVAEVRRAPGGRVLDAHDRRRTADPAGVLAHLGRLGLRLARHPGVDRRRAGDLRVSVIDREACRSLA
jgi:5-methylphenazine-1-carboxylate 1-monooxygenase